MSEREAKMGEELDGLLVALSKAAMRANAGTALISFRATKKYGGGDVFILFGAKGYDRFDLVKTLTDALEDEPEVKREG